MIEARLESLVMGRIVDWSKLIVQSLLGRLDVVVDSFMIILNVVIITDVLNGCSLFSETLNRFLIGISSVSRGLEGRYRT